MRNKSNNSNKYASKSLYQKGSKKRAKSQYKVRNWSEYNKSLVKRGDLTIFISDDVQLICPRKDKSKKRGRPCIYTDKFIEICCIFRQLYGLALRQTEGFVRGVIKMMELGIRVPCFSQISRRMKQLDIQLDIKSRHKEEGVVIAVDSTGLKVYGEGEWKVRQYGWTKRRRWKKMHLSVDTASGEILSIETTSSKVADAGMVSSLLSQIPADIQVEAMIGDGAYDKQKVYDSLVGRGIKAIIPPRKDAKIVRHGNHKGAAHPRDNNLRYIREKGRKSWKQALGYHRRNIVEITMFRYKMLFSGRIRSREEQRQAVEVKLNCKILNQMMSYGMPVTEKVA